MRRRSVPWRKTLPTYTAATSSSRILVQRRWVVESNGLACVDRRGLNKATLISSCVQENWLHETHPAYLHCSRPKMTIERRRESSTPGLAVDGRSRRVASCCVTICQVGRRRNFREFQNKWHNVLGLRQNAGSRSKNKQARAPEKLSS